MSYSAKPLIFRSRKGFDIVVETIVENENVFPGIPDTFGPVTGLQARVVTPRTIPLFKMGKKIKCNLIEQLINRLFIRRLLFSIPRIEMEK
jgi:hypothetical protein